MTKLANEDVGKLFTISEAEWTAINKRVGLVILVENIGAEMQKTLPSYFSLLAASKRWRSGTFPGIVDHSANVAAYATTSIAAFSTLRDRIAALPPLMTNVPDDLAATVRQTLRNQRDATAVQAATSATLETAIDDFRIVNDAVDSDIECSRTSTWSTVSAQTHAVSAAISHVKGTWGALLADVTVASADGVVMTTPFLTGLQIEVSISAWERIQTEATAFGSMAAGQQVYLMDAPRKKTKENDVTTIIEDNPQMLFRMSATGPFMQANLLPVSGQGKVRVTYNWLYSSLNCDPNDTSTFLWTFIKLNDTQVALSPTLPYEDMTLYASVRPDIGFGVQVQAPWSADWITAVGGDETITLNMRDLSLATFQGLNGAYIFVNPTPDQHDDHTGYRLFSTGGDPNAALFLVQPTVSLQSGLVFRQTKPWTPERLQEMVARQGVTLGADQLARLARHMR